MERVENSLFEINQAGDVIAPTDLSVDLEEVPVSTADSDFDPDDELDYIRKSADFRNRNIRLMMAADHVGNQRQAEGAAEQASYGNRVSRRYSDPGHMADIISSRDREAKEAIRRACGSCAIADYCNLSNQDLQNNLRDAKVRQRFKNRLVADDYSKNNHLCATSLDGDRLKPGTA